ncbi:MAG: hypothetical protein FWE08_07325 [Oscillospiraceae bacterium]|nr:hypothetical protein [Oscillospiraceae bacterium]
MKTYIKRTLYILFIFALILPLAACGSGDNTAGDAGINEDFIGKYIYLSTQLALPELPERVQGTAHGDRIFYLHTDQDEIVITSITADGTDPQMTRISRPEAGAEIIGFRITETGGFAIITADHERERVLYAEYGTDGREVFTRNLSHIVPQGSWFLVTHAFFAADGRMVLTARTERGDVLCLLGADGTLLGQLEPDAFGGITALQDGRVVAFDGNALREINFAAGDWGETLSFTMSGVQALHPATEAHPFDLLADDGLRLYGYNLTTNERTPLLNWVEAGIAAQSTDVGFLDDGRISVVVRRLGAPAAITVLTRTARADLPDYTVITLGGLAFNDWVLDEVVAFNMENRDYQIHVVEYDENWRTSWDGREAAEFRFSTDLMTGNAPDIILVPPDMGDALITQGLLADFYPLIDADPALSRSDFFPNILQAMEAPDGTLPIISESFDISTMVGMPASVGHVDSWTLADFIALLEAEAADMPYIMGDWVAGESIVFYGYENFIDWEAGIVAFDSPAFIDLLEVAARFPRPSDFPDHGSWHGNPDYTRMRRGEQLLMHAWLSPLMYREISAALDGVHALGFPVGAGGVHRISVQEQFAISAVSPHQAAAWQFVRRILLPEFPIFTWTSFPLQMGRYDEMIADAVTPKFDSETGEERSVFYAYIYEGLTIPVLAMTVEEAASLRVIVENARVFSRLDERVWDMVQEELQPFFAGDRSAVDTARVVQNRVQMLLHERG